MADGWDTPFDEPWQIHPDSETPINDLGDLEVVIIDKPF